MLIFLVRRVLWAVVLCFALTFVTYLIMFQIPADPARYLVRVQAAPGSDLSKQLEEAREKLGVDKPIYISTRSSSTEPCTWTSGRPSPATAHGTSGR